MNAVPPARKAIDPVIAFPLALFGVLKRHEARPLAAFAPPFTFAPAKEAAHEIPAGRIAVLSDPQGAFFAIFEGEVDD